MRYRTNPKIQISSTGFLKNPIDNSDFWYHGGSRLKGKSIDSSFSKQSTNAFYVSSGLFTPAFFMKLTLRDCLFDRYSDAFFTNVADDAYSDTAFLIELISSVCALSIFRVKDSNFFNADQLTPSLRNALLECVKKNGGVVNDFDQLEKTYYFQYFQKNPALLGCIKSMGYVGWFESEGDIRIGNDLNIAILEPHGACVFVDELNFEQELPNAEFQALIEECASFVKFKLSKRKQSYGF